MAQFIVNPRRAPRAPFRCRATVVWSAGSFDAETEDVGLYGCQLVAPVRLDRGDPVELTVSSEGLAEVLRMPGVIAWVSARAPWRVGVAFDEALLALSGRWFEKLVALNPGIASFRRVPDRIATDATVYLGPPPRFVVDFTADEAALLRAIASGARIDELQARLRADWPAAQRALFSLFARHAVTLARGQAAHPAAWKKILADVEARLAVESLDGAAPPPVRAPPSPPAPPARAASTPAPVAPASGVVPDAPRGAPGRRSPREVELEDGGPALEVIPMADPAWDPRGTPAPGHPPDHQGAGVAWRGVGRARSAEAQAAFDRARAELENGNVSGSISLLRRALALAPGDPEIADALGKLAFGDRGPGAR